MVRRPRNPRNTSSGPAQNAVASKVARRSFQQRSFAETMPSSRSEWPLRYLVPASIAMSTPRACGGKNSGVAQVLSISTIASRACATAAIAGMSCISNESEPGASVNTARVFGLNSCAISAPTSGS
jgi:hypothetical protein